MLTGRIPKLGAFIFFVTFWMWVIGDIMAGVKVVDQFAAIYYGMLVPLINWVLVPIYYGLLAIPTLFTGISASVALTFILPVTLGVALLVTVMYLWVNRQSLSKETVSVGNQNSDVVKARSSSSNPQPVSSSAQASSILATLDGVSSNVADLVPQNFQNGGGKGSMSPSSSSSESQPGNPVVVQGLADKEAQPADKEAVVVQPAAVVEILEEQPAVVQEPADKEAVVVQPADVVGTLFKPASRGASMGCAREALSNGGFEQRDLSEVTI